MENQLAVEVLLRQRDAVIVEMNKAKEKFKSEITQLETSIERLSGKKVWEVSQTVFFDDDTHDYIKSSQEEM